MATQLFTTVLAHTDNATFRTWAKEVSDQLIAIGVTRTSDTGQINFTTVTRPGTNTAGGYEIFRFNDTLQSTAPIFFKLEYGTGSAATSPQMWLTVGTGSDGAGNINGVTVPRSSCSINSAPSSTTTSYNSYLCYTAGFLGLAWKTQAQGTTNKGQGFFAICRSVDDLGDLTGDHVYVYRQNIGSSQYHAVQVANFVSSVTLTESTDGSHSVVPQNVATSLVGTSAQVFKHYVCVPRVRPVFGCLTVLNSEVGYAAQFGIIPVGATVSHNYLSLGPSQQYASIGGTTNTCLAMLWE